jgi:hypothetical protein
VRRWLSVVLGAGLIIAAVWITTASPAEAATCTGSSISGSGSVVVPSGATCTLNGVTINGSITVESGGTLSLTDSIVRGTVTANQANSVVLRGNFLMGLSINGSAAGSVGGFSVCQNVIAGPVNITSVGATALGVTVGGPICGANTICGPFSARYNAAPLSIRDNVVTGAGSVAFNSQLQSFFANTFGGLISSTGNSPNNGGPNTANDAGARSATCGEPTSSSSSSTSSSSSSSTSSSSTSTTATTIILF